MTDLSDEGVRKRLNSLVAPERRESTPRACISLNYDPTRQPEDHRRTAATTRPSERNRGERPARQPTDVRHAGRRADAPGVEILTHDDLEEELRL